MSRKYNFIFKELTGGDSNNILGLIAYSIYKNDKIKFIEDWESNNNGELCPDDEINRFHKDSMRRILHYRELAAHQTAIFMENLISDHIDTYKDTAKSAQKEALEELIKDQKNGFEKTISTCKIEVQKLKTTWKDYVVSGVIGSVSFLLFIFLCGLVFRLWWIDIIGTAIKSVVGV